MSKLETLNQLSRDEAIAELLRCCGSKNWAEQMVELRPFATKTVLFEKADTVWKNLSQKDWLEAFSHHPKIGGAANSKWAKQEQSGVQGATQEVLERLATANQEYEARFGYIFLICATGKSASEMLSALESRMGNKPEQEIHIAAQEQAKITQIRLEKFLNS